ncbi:deoxyribodipyrimidine photo-lyase [Bodo saltans virus]|uniref:Deoxyribodipyrimidine photo-lyase n=1 Tax=Bodo saltans virus TaxID=2024608 RepID=A0A2H4UUA7_9VIRU|nr:deoxyribodipyrimidine photo-lyase [Bodo saltans virus]ATZ80437.1 deoxyribodipyrimidine photo-lyase [Bodo saltans virus]
MNIFVILPHQLYDKKYLDKKYKYVIYEHPHYFLSYNYNKKKIILHRGSMRYYYDYLRENNYMVKYIEFNDKFDIQEYKLFNPIDKIELKNKYTIIDSPNFLLTDNLCQKYRKKTQNFFFNAFYMWSKKELNIMPNVKSQDDNNRKSLPKNIEFEKISSNNFDNKYIDIGKKYVDKHFEKNYGNTENFMFPLTHKTAKKWLNDFIKNKIDNFGTYQDAITQKSSTVFHSMLSTSINIGLLQPIDIIKEILKYDDIPLNSLEGFIRQLFWREYQRYCYIFCNFDNMNYFGNNTKITKKWYDGTLGILPVDNAIKRGFETGYLHHIERLMVVGNYMNLSGIKPNDGFRWFMEFSCDSYLWVMHQNVYDMVFFVSGGETMRRPYVSSSNYILKMSDYKKDIWCDIWDDMYVNFVKKNKKKLWKFRYYFKNL